jgi:glycosyltransferase involved in cell wall biosynthesis
MSGRSVDTPTGPSRHLGDRAAGRARVSIGVPVFNGARYLEDCLESLITQTYGDLEILISDNGSTDETPVICRAYCERDHRVRYHRQPRNIGAAANYNFLVRNTSGELFKWAAHDDVCAPDLVARCVAALDTSPTAVLAFGRTGFIDDLGDQLHGYDVPIRWSNYATSFARLREQLEIPQGAVHHMCTRQFGVMRRDQLLRTSLIRNHPAADLVLMLELALLGGLVPVEDHPDCLFFTRLHEDSSMRANQSAAELAQWYDPRSGDSYPLKWTRVLTGYVRAVLNSSLPRREKVGGLLLIARWFVSDDNWRIIGGELKRRLPGLVPVHLVSRAARRP